MKLNRAASSWQSAICNLQSAIPGLGRRRCGREGFTLVELLVVVAIIAMLASLLLAAVQKARTVVEILDCRKDITELNKAINAFCTDTRLGAPGYLPSKLQGDAGKGYFARLFPRADAAGAQLPQNLDGAQCLVFFLGGPNAKGWSSNPRNPFEGPRPGIDRIGPFYEFRADRLAPPGGVNPRYLDRWRKQPIAYFCATRNAGTQWVPNEYDQTDCQGLNVLPYPSMNTTSFQLISAGPDGVTLQGGFGNKGNVWSPLNPNQTYARGDMGADDITNFWGGPLGGKR